MASKIGVSKDANAASFMFNGAGKGKALQVKLVGMGSTDLIHSLHLACIELPAQGGIT